MEQKKKTDLRSYLNYSDSLHIVIISSKMERREEEKYGNRNQELLAHIYKILAFRGEVAAGVTKGTREFKDYWLRYPAVIHQEWMR